MRSASSADNRAICVTFSLPHENAVELQNMARSCAGRLRELGVLAVQVGNTTAISLQPRTGNICPSVDQCGTRDHRQQTLNATRRNIAQYLGADISSFPPVGSSNTVENDMQNSSVHHQNVANVSLMSTGFIKDQSANLVAESSPHIVNLLQHDVISSRSVCLSSSMPISSAGDVPVRPKKRARRRTQSAAAEVSVPLSMLGSADSVNSVYSVQQPPSCVNSSTDVSPVHNMLTEQFKIPESRRRKACQSRKSTAAKSQQLPVTGQALSNNLSHLFNVGFSECSKPSELGMFHTGSTYSMGDSFQMNGVNPYYRIPIMTTGWQTHATPSVPSNGIYQRLPASAAYPHEYGHPRFRFAGNVDYSQVTANASRVPGVGSHRNVTPGLSAVFVSDTSQMHLKEQVPSFLATHTLRWPSAAESNSTSVAYGSSNSSVVPIVRGVYDVTRGNGGVQPVSHVMQRQFLASRSDAPPVSVGSKPCTETVTPVSEKTVQLSVSSDIDRIKNVPVCDVSSISSLSGGHINVPVSVNYQHANGLFADVHSSVLAFRGHTAHVKMNGDIECLQHDNSQALSKCATVFEKSTAVTVTPYAALASSVAVCIGDTNCVAERLLQQPSVQVPAKVQQCGLANFEDTGLNGCSAGTTSDMPKLSISSGIMKCIL